MVSLILPPMASLAFGGPNVSLAKVSVPETFEETGKMGKGFFERARERFPEIIKGIWEGEVLPIWRKMYDKWSNWWDYSIQPWLRGIWQKIISLFKKEAEEKKPIIEEQFQKEKEEIKKELPGVSKSLWEKFKELLK